MENIKIDITVEEFKFIMSLISGQPHGQVDSLINKLKEQGASQFKDFQNKKNDE